MKKITEYAIEIKDASKIYKSNNVKAVDTLSLKIKKGEIFGLLGPNGAGKTTLIRMLVGLLEPTSGEILYSGEKIQFRSPKLRKKVGYVPQEVVIWKDLTTYENLHLIGTIYQIPEKELKEKINRLLKGLYLEDKKSELANNLSGGMLRRLNLAMGMIHDPEILFLDEVFVGLDPQTRVYLYDYLRNFAAEDKTIIITSHLMEIVDSLSDRVGIIDYGKALAIDAPEKLKNTFGKGDLLEIEIEKTLEEKDDLLHQLREINGELSLSADKNVIQILTLNAIQKLPTILNIIEKDNHEVLNVNLAKQSLETVFISLTGRSLRV